MLIYEESVECNGCQEIQLAHNCEKRYLINQGQVKLTLSCSMIKLSKLLIIS